ncbi:MAG: glycosyl transferase [Actinomycetales bacterium]|nr:MAG: glycosyl transferase [Actinomycetales bacterium]
MKVLVVHGRYRSGAPSGENRVVDIESAALMESGHDVVTYTTNSDDIAGWSLPRKAMVPIHSIRNPRSRSELRKLLRSERPHVVHVHNTFPMISATALQACADERVPVVITLHNYKLLCASGDFFRRGKPCHDCAGGSPWPGLRHGCYRGSRLATAPVTASLLVNRSLWRENVAAYMFISAAQRDLLMPGLNLPVDRVFVKHNLIPLIPLNVNRTRRNQIAYVGRLDPAKGLPLLMESWDLFCAQEPHSELRLVIAGGGPMEREVAEWGAGRPRVDVLGLISSADVASLLGTSLAVVVPSQWEETFGLVIVEAMAAGTAVIAAGHGAFPELVRDGTDGKLFTPGSPGALAAVMRDAAENPQLFQQMGRAAEAAYQDRFDAQGNLRQLLSIYDFAVRHPVWDET